MGSGPVLLREAKGLGGRCCGYVDKPGPGGWRVSEADGAREARMLREQLERRHATMVQDKRCKRWLELVREHGIIEGQRIRDRERAIENGV